MTMLIMTEPILEQIQKHFKDYGITSSIPRQRLDFESDYLNTVFLGTKDGISSAGSLKLENSPIDYVSIIKKQEYTRCDYVLGSHVGMGIHKHAWWKMRFFLTFPEPIHIGPFDIGTITTIKKGLFNSKVESFMWNGYQKLTTLPPGLVRDNVVEPLNHDQRLTELMMKCLLNERIITISRYSPHHKTKSIKTNSKIVIESKWRIQSDLFVNDNTMEMYEKMAKIVKQTINNLKYHLT